MSGMVGVASRRAVTVVFTCESFSHVLVREFFKLPYIAGEKIHGCSSSVVKVEGKIEALGHTHFIIISPRSPGRCVFGVS